MNLCATHELLIWQEEATIDLFAVGGVRIDLAFGVNPAQQTVAVPPRRVAADENNLALAGRPLALDAIESPANVENEIVSASLTEGPVDVETELNRRERDRHLGNVALLICREHTPSVVATPDDARCRNRLRRSGRGLDRH